jgi:hypothetical protein
LTLLRHLGAEAASAHADRGATRGALQGVADASARMRQDLNRHLSVPLSSELLCSHGDYLLHRWKDRAGTGRRPAVPDGSADVDSVYELVSRLRRDLSALTALASYAVEQLGVDRNPSRWLERLIIEHIVGCHLQHLGPSVRSRGWIAGFIAAVGPLVREDVRIGKDLVESVARDVLSRRNGDPSGS